MSSKQLFLYFIIAYSYFPDCYSLSTCWKNGSESRNPCGFKISGVNLNFTASWNGCEQYNGSAPIFSLMRKDFDGSSETVEVPLCKTNATSCYIGGALLTNMSADFFIGFVTVNQTLDHSECEEFFVKSNIQVGPPEVLSSDVQSRNVSLVVRGPATPLYLDESGNSFRDSDWSGSKRRIYMGMAPPMRSVTCCATLYNSTDYELEQVRFSLDERSAEQSVDFSNLTPFTHYQIRIKCKMDEKWGDSTVFPFNTAEEDCYSSSPCWRAGSHSERSCGFKISGANLNFTASWNGCEENNCSAPIFSLIRTDYISGSGVTPLCKTNATSCYIGGALLTNMSADFFFGLVIVIQTVDHSECNGFFSMSNFQVGPPEVLSSVVQSRNVSLVVRGPATPLYLDESGNYFRDSDWSGSKRKIYMGMAPPMRSVTCCATLYNSTDDALEQVKASLNEKSAQQRVDFSNLTPFTHYQIRIKCEMDKKWGDNTVFPFNTAEEVPARGPSILKPLSVGQGCIGRDKRNVTIKIEPPPKEDHNGKLTLYEIHYCKVPACQDERKIIVPFDSPPPPSMAVVLEDVPRWHEFEIKVYANNSAGGTPSSTHQIPVLRPSGANSSPVNLTKTEREHGLWRLDWLAPWPPHTGDCIDSYEVWEGDRLVGSTLNTSILLNNSAVGTLKVTPLIYNGNGTLVTGIPSDTIVVIGEPLTAQLSTPLIVFLTIILFVFLVLAVSCAYMCVEHGPRWTENYDFRNNSILKAALAMGELRPKAPPEKEQFNNLVNLPPAHDPSDPNTNNPETTVLLEPQAEPDVGEVAAPRTPTNNQTPPPAAEGRFAARDGCHLEETCTPMETDETSGSALSSSEEDNSPAVTSSSSSADQGDDAPRRMSCSEDSLVSTPPPTMSYGDSGYVMSPPIPSQSFCFSTKNDGYLKRDALGNLPYKVALDNAKHCQISTASRNDYVSNTKFLQSLAVGTSNTPYTRLPDVKIKVSRDKGAPVMSHGRQSSVDSEGLSSGSLSPSDTDMGEYTKLSCPNTPVSSRNGNSHWDNFQRGMKPGTDETLKSIQDQLGNFSESLQPGLLNVG